MTPRCVCGGQLEYIGTVEYDYGNGEISTDWCTNCGSLYIEDYSILEDKVVSTETKIPSNR